MPQIRGSVTFGQTKTDAEAREWQRVHEIIQSTIASVSTHARLCNCIGPQRGETLCPCALLAESQKGVEMIDKGLTINGRRYRLVPEDET